MKLEAYIKKHTTRKQFAEQLGTTLFYINNLCQHPEQAGKKMIAKIQQATNGKVTFSDMVGV